MHEGNSLGLKYFNGDNWTFIMQYVATGLSLQHNNFLRPWSILMKFFTVAVHNPESVHKGNNSGLEYFKEDDWTNFAN